MPTRKFHARRTGRRTPIHLSNRNFGANQRRRPNQTSRANRWVDTPDHATTPREVLRLLVRALLVFAALIGIPTFVAHTAHQGSMPDVTAWLHTQDAKGDIRVYDAPSDSTTSMSLNNYILEVLAAEFSPDAPMDAPMDALKAAAVATRTYAIHAMTAGAPSTSVAAQHGADVTNDSQLDLPLATESDVENEFPSQAYPFLARLQAAIEATDGTIVTYQEKPILAFMFEVSAGSTRSSQAVVGANVPYLKQIACPDDLTDPDRISTDILSFRDVGQALGASDVAFSDLKLKRASDGFVLSVTAKGRTVSGTDFANSLNLPSADFTWQQAPGGLKVTTIGRGTGIGMSLNEAEALSRKGVSWRNIIYHFYPDTTIQSDRPFIASSTAASPAI